MIVVATDAPLDARDLTRLAARAVFGLARTGSSYSQRQRRLRDRVLDRIRRCASRFGETARRARARCCRPTAVSPLFQAALEATEEAVYNSLLKATTVTGNGVTAEAIPVDRVREILRKYGVSAGR